MSKWVIEIDDSKSRIGASEFYGAADKKDIIRDALWRGGIEVTNILVHRRSLKHVKRRPAKAKGLSVQPR